MHDPCRHVGKKSLSTKLSTTALGALKPKSYSLVEGNWSIDHTLSRKYEIHLHNEYLQNQSFEREVNFYLGPTSQHYLVDIDISAKGARSDFSTFLKLSEILESKEGFYFLHNPCRIFQLKYILFRR